MLRGAMNSDFVGVPLVGVHARAGRVPAPTDPTAPPPATGAGGALFGDAEAGAAVLHEAADGAIGVTVICAGRSRNGNEYSAQLLEHSAPMFEGARVFAKSDAQHLAGGGKDVRALLGALYDARWDAASQSVRATFRPLDADEPTVRKMRAALEQGMAGLLGLSIDATARTEPLAGGGRRVLAFERINSVDVIVEPGAGGSLDSLHEAAGDVNPKETQTMDETTQGSAAAADAPAQGEGGQGKAWRLRALAAIARAAPERDAAADAALPDDELIALYERLCGALDAPAAQDEPAEAAPAGHVAEAAAAAPWEAALEDVQRRFAAKARIAESALPKAAKERLAQRVDLRRGAELSESAISHLLEAEAKYVASISGSGGVHVPSFGSVRVENRSQRMREMLDAFFDSAHKEHRSVQSLRECYVEMTGDRRLTGRLAECDLGRLAESCGVLREAVDTTTWATALGGAIERRMQAVYTGLEELDAWKKVAIWGPVGDFRTQERMQLGGYGPLPTVAEGDPYKALDTPGEARARYAVTKRGGTEEVTLEAIRNDDTQALRRIPQELALAAKATLYEFVMDFFNGSATAIYDGQPLHCAAHQNLFDGALSAEEFARHRLAMLQQTRMGSGRRLATGPKVLLVPFELQEVAFNLFVRGQNLDKTFVQSINPDIVPVSYWTDPAAWVTVADPAVLPVVEIGFLDGREEPELFVQDTPSVGSMFSHDKLTYKIRHIYGGAVLVDGEKGTTRAAP